MKILLVSTLFMLLFSGFSIFTASGIEETRIIISEVDDEIFTAALDSTIISTNGSVIGKLEIAKSENIGQVFVLESKKDSYSLFRNQEIIVVPIITTIGSFVAGYLVAILHEQRNTKNMLKRNLESLLDEIRILQKEPSLSKELWVEKIDGKMKFNYVPGIKSPILDSTINSGLFGTLNQEVQRAIGRLVVDIDLLNIVGEKLLDVVYDNPIDSIDYDRIDAISSYALDIRNEITKTTIKILPEIQNEIEKYS